MFELTRKERRLLKLDSITKPGVRTLFEKRLNSEVQGLLNAHEKKKEALRAKRDQLIDVFESHKQKLIELMRQPTSSWTRSDFHTPGIVSNLRTLISKANKELASFEPNRPMVIREAAARSIEGFHPLTPVHSYVAYLTNIKSKKRRAREVLTLSRNIREQAGEINFDLPALPRQTPRRLSEEWLELHWRLLPLFYAMLNKGRKISELTGRD